MKKTILKGEYQYTWLYRKKLHWSRCSIEYWLERRNNNAACGIYPGWSTIRFRKYRQHKSINSNLPVTTDIYKENLTERTFYFLQNIARSPFQVIVKYDWYDPNTEIEGDEIGKSVSSTTVKPMQQISNILHSVWVLLYRWDANVKLTAYYDSVTNETSQNLSGYTKDLKDKCIHTSNAG